MRIKYNATSWSEWEKIITESSALWKNNIKNLDNNADLNTLNNVNIVQIYRCGYSTNRVNAPQDWYGGILISSLIGGFGFQIAFTYNSTNMYIRTFYNENWNVWKKL